MLIFTKIHEQHFLRIKKVYEMNNQFKNTDIEIAESVDLNEPLEEQITFLENINRNVETKFLGLKTGSLQIHANLLAICAKKCKNV